MYSVRDLLIHVPTCAYLKLRSFSVSVTVYPIKHVPKWSCYEGRGFSAELLPSQSS